jgi:transposase
MPFPAIDLGKQSFHFHGITDEGEVISKKISRSKLEATVRRHDPETVAMEASASAHHWGRSFETLGYPVRFIHPRFVMPFVKGSKNDAVDAEVIHEVALRPTMRFVPVKTTEQQDLQMPHRTRDRLITQRTGLINHIRGLLGEYSAVIPVGAFRFRKDIRNTVAEAELSALATENFNALIAEFEALDKRVAEIDRKLVGICRTDERCKRLATLPGVGPVIATALIAAVDDGRHFSSGRALAAWIGLVPRQYTTGGKPRLGGIGKRGNQYLRRQLIHGARSVLIRITNRSDQHAKWAQNLLARVGHNKTLVAIANKTARIAWAVLCSGESYKAA